MDVTDDPLGWWNGSWNSNASANVSAAAHPKTSLLAEYPDALLQFAVAACVLFILVGVPGNFITILALLRYSKVSDTLRA